MVIEHCWTWYNSSRHRPMPLNYGTSLNSCLRSGDEATRTQRTWTCNQMMGVVKTWCEMTSGVVRSSDINLVYADGARAAEVSVCLLSMWSQSKRLFNTWKINPFAASAPSACTQSAQHTHVPFSDKRSIEKPATNWASRVVQRCRGVALASVAFFYSCVVLEEAKPKIKMKINNKMVI